MPDPQEALNAATRLLQSGQHAAAREQLATLLRAAPERVEAHRLLAHSLLQTQDFAQAVGASNAWLARQPDSVEAQVLLARALSGQGRHAEAADALRSALDRAPEHAGALATLAQFTTLGRTLLSLGNPSGALAALGAIAGSGAASGDLLMLCGHALMALGRFPEAEAMFRRWLQREPGNANAALTLAAVLADHGGAVESEALVRHNIARSGESVETAFVLARALLEQARFVEAEAEFRKVVRARPEHQTAQANLMELVWMRSGDVREAGRSLDEALSMQPRLAGLRITKARLLASARMPREALAELDADLARTPRDAGLLRAAATVALEFDGARSLDYARRALAVAPDDYVARVALGNASLAVGRAGDALAVAEALHLADPNDGQPLALKADALRMLDDPRCRELLDYKNFVRGALLDVPEGWDDLGAYLADLVRDLESLHTLRAHPIGNSLRGGSQVQLVPQQSPFASIRAFPQAIDGPIRRYMQALGRGDDPMRRRNAPGYALSGVWSVRLRANGFHANHYHPQGWISSSCYLHLPPAVAGHSGEGWIKFGEPAFPTAPALPPEYFLKPEPGLLALFPSYMWHGTVPFSGGEQDTRLTMPFDVVPQG